MKNALLLLLLSILVLAVGCSQEEPVSVQEIGQSKMIPLQDVNVKEQALLQEPIVLHRVEQVGEALAVWRKFSERKPSLLLLSNDPMLIEVPKPLRQEVKRVAVQGRPDELSRAMSYENPDPLLLPPMTLDTALRAEWFGKVVWATPVRDQTLGMTLSNVISQLLDSKLISEVEVETFRQEKNLILGEVRNVPFVLGALSHLGELQGPLIVHIDQTYFQSLYKNEIATPLLSLIKQTLTSLREMNLPVLAVTFSYGNMSQRISLDVRYVGDVLESILERPEMLDRSMPTNWNRQSDIFYLENFFQAQKVMETALRMEEDDPNSAWVKFSLYRAAASNKQGDQALKYLAEAVALDRVYALEYLTLSKLAFNKGRPDEALRMLTLAGKQFPDNPFIKLDMAQLAINQNDNETALHLLEQVQKLEWSEIYYPDMPQYLEKFAAYLKGEDVSKPEDTIKDPRRQRILK